MLANLNRFILLVLFFSTILSSFLLLANNKALADDKKLSSEKLVEPWQVWRKNSTLKVSYQPIKNSELIKIKAQATFTSSLSGFLTFIQNTTETANWLAKAKSSQVIKQINQQERIFITHFDAFWPIKARYMLLQSRYWQNDDLSVELAISDVDINTIRLNELEGNIEADVKDNSTAANTIKVEVYEAHWLLTPITANKMTIDYTFVADAKGELPIWLTNKFALRSIWQTLKNIEQQLPYSLSQQARLAGIKELNSSEN